MKRVVVLMAALIAACSGSATSATTSAPPAVATTTAATSPAAPPVAPVSTTTLVSTTTTEPPNPLVCWSAPVTPAAGDLEFEDVTAEMGVLDPLLGMHAHAMAWGDVDGDGWDDLFVGSFADRPAADYALRGAGGPSPDRLLRGGPDGFRLDDSFPGELARTSGAAFADLDGDGDVDLVLARAHRPRAPVATDTVVMENVDGTFQPGRVLLSEFGGRSIGVLDYDGDAAYDLFIVEDRWSGGSSRLLHNDGGLRFSDATSDAGLPADIAGLGVNVTDLTGDGDADIFVAGSNRLFVDDGGGRFVEADSTVFAWDLPGPEDDPAGVTAADLTRDGLPELIIGQHFNSAFEGGAPQPVRLYLNRGTGDDGLPVFEDITEEAGLVPLPTKSPGVDIVDLDNDGWPDIITTAAVGDGTQPAVFHHTGVVDGIPRFEAPTGLGISQYWVTGAATDVDHDGRTDLMLIEWEPALASPLLRNVTAGGHWLAVDVASAGGTALGAVVEVYQAGQIGSPGGLLGAGQMTATSSYGAGRPTAVRFGLGEEAEVDVRIRFADGTGTDLAGVAADAYIRVPEGCG